MYDHGWVQRKYRGGNTVQGRGKIKPEGIKLNPGISVRYDLGWVQGKE
jgi:hypothetical protein